MYPQSHSVKITQITEVASTRSDLEEVLWSHMENVIAPEVIMFHMHDPDDQPQVIIEVQFWL